MQSSLSEKTPALKTVLTRLLFLSESKEWKQLEGFVCWYNVEKREN